MRKDETTAIRVELDSEVLAEVKDLADQENKSLDALVNQGLIVLLATRRAENVINDYGDYSNYGKPKWSVGIVSKAF